MRHSKGTLGNNSWTIYNGDCLDIIENYIEEGSIDCIVTSPPYLDCRVYGQKPQKDGNIANWLYAKKGKAIRGEIGNGCSQEKYFEDLGNVFESCYKILKNNKFMFINIGNKRSQLEFIDLSHETIKRAKEKKFIHRDTVIWIKRNPPPAGKHQEKYLANGWEYVLVFTKGKPEKIYYEKYLNIEDHFRCEKCNADNHIERKIRPNYFYSNIGCFGRKRQPIKHHPALFPIEVPRFCLSITTNEEDLIFDPFAGSGTTLIAGLEQKLNVIGCELVPEIYENVINEMKNIRC